MYTLVEQPDVFVDAMAADHRAQLLFLSLFGRDTSVQQLLARLHQPVREGGVELLSAADLPVAPPLLQLQVGDARRLDKVTGRIPRRGLLGNFVHAWIFDPAVLAADPVTQSAWILEPRLEADDMVTQAWSLVNEISPVPLLDSWREPVMNHLLQERSVGRIESTPCIGRIQAHRVELLEGFPAWVAAGVRQGLLPLPAESGQ